MSSEALNSKRNLKKSLGREFEIFYPAMVQELFPQLFRYMLTLPPGLTAFVKALAAEKDQLHEPIATDAENIAATRKLVELVLENLAPVVNKLHGKTKEIAMVMLLTQAKIAAIKQDPHNAPNRWRAIKKLLNDENSKYGRKNKKRPVVSNLMFLFRKKTHEILQHVLDQEIAEDKWIDPEKIEFFIAQLRQILEKSRGYTEYHPRTTAETEDYESVEPCKVDIEISQNEGFNPDEIQDIRFFSIPIGIQTRLLFEPFEAIAEKEGILPEEAIASKMNREAMVNALSQIAGLNMSRARNIYRLAIIQQRKNPRDKYASNCKKVLLSGQKRKPKPLDLR